jgi:hypothetical protein
MNTATRIALTVTMATAAAMAAPLLVFPGIQTVSQLLWQVSYWLPSGLAGPVTWLLVLAMASLAITALILVIVRIWRK